MREDDRWGVLPNWASQSTVSAQKMYSTYSSISAAEALPWPQSVKDAVLAGKGAAWKATITACAVPNAEIESAREFLTNGVPAEVASILTRARSNWVNFFSSYPDNTKLQRKAQLYTRGTGAWEVREAQQMAAFLTHLSSRLESYFIDPASAWEFLADHGALAEAGSYNVTPGYGGLYDDYMGLIGAIAYLGSGGALMGSGYPTFLTSSQLGRTKAYVRSAIGKDAFSTIKLGSFAINDTQDIYSVHNLMKETDVIVGMKEMEVLDLPQFHIRWQTSDGTEAMTEAPTFTSNWKYRNDYNSAAMGTLSLPSLRPMRHGPTRARELESAPSSTHKWCRLQLCTTVSACLGANHGCLEQCPDSSEHSWTVRRVLRTHGEQSVPSLYRDQCILPSFASLYPLQAHTSRHHRWW